MMFSNLFTLQDCIPVMSASYFDRRMTPSLIRFVMELSTWIWLIFFNIIILIISVFSLAIFNVPGDKKAIGFGTTGLAVVGPVRVAIELTTAGVGIAAAFSVGNLIIEFYTLIL